MPFVAIPDTTYRRLSPRWSYAVPRSPGGYWWRRLDSNPLVPPRVIQVEWKYGDLYIMDPSLNYERRAIDVGGEWAGPIQEPDPCP